MEHVITEGLVQGFSIWFPSELPEEFKEVRTPSPLAMINLVGSFPDNYNYYADI